MSDIIVPIVVGFEARVALLEERTRQRFRTALESVVDATFQDARRDLGVLRVEDLVGIMRRALDAERANFGGL
jgi:hypothetical protein